MKAYDIVGYVTGDGVVLCDDCVIHDVDDEESPEPVFVSDGMISGAVCDSCDALFDGHGEWRMPPVRGVEAMREAIDDHR